MNSPTSSSSERSHLTARVANPLATVSIFLTFCEITAGFAATQTAGWIQALFGVFSVAFPIMVGAGLFVILWKKPEVLYAPGDYSKDTPIRDYVDAVRGGGLSSAARQTEAIEQIVTSAIESTIVKFREDPTANLNVDARTLARSVANIEIKKSTIEVQMPIVGKDSALGRILIPADEDEMYVDDFLDTLYFAMDGLVPPYTYGKTWMIFDAETNQAFDKIGSTYLGRELNKRSGDNRPLHEVGIIAGRPIVVRLLEPPSRYAWRT
jgi:hypothetical protein